MLLRRMGVALVVAGLVTLSIGVVSGQSSPGVVSGLSYPGKTIRVVTSPAGGGGDVISRLVAQGISGPLGQAVIVDNRSVGGIQGEIVSKAPADGYTLQIGSGDFWIGPFLREARYDPVKDFSPVTLLAISPSLLVVTPSLPVKSVKELIALAKAKPGELNYGSSGTGSPNHLPAELFKTMAGINIVRVNYKGTGQALSGVVGGEVQLMFANAASAMPSVRSGKLKALAVTTAQPTALAPGLPTVTASDLPGYEAASIYGMFAPAKTPAAIINRLNQEVVKFLNRPDVKEKFFNAGSDVVGSTPQEFAATMKADMAKWGKVIKDAGIHGD